MGSWSDKVLAILPAEVTAVYLAIRSVVTLVADTQMNLYEWIPLVLFVCILILTAAAPVFARIVRGIKFRYDGLIIAASFPIWALNIDYQRMIDLAGKYVGKSTLIVIQFGLPISLIMWAGLVIPIVTAISVKETAHASR